MKARCSISAFTLIELLTVIAIIGVLAALMFPLLSRAREHAKTATEVSTARQLMAGYLVASNDQKGRLFSGSRDATAYDEQGNSLSSLVAARYPYRLLPYVGGALKGSLYIGEQTNYYDTTIAGYTASQASYLLSLVPSFGMNMAYVGGIWNKNTTTGTYMVRSDYQPVTRLAEAAAPANLIVFARTRNRQIDDSAGYHEAKAPTYAGWPQTAPSDESVTDATTGWVAVSSDKPTTVGLLDGHVERLDYDQLLDMRRWSDAAYRADDANWHH